MGTSLQEPPPLSVHDLSEIPMHTRLDGETDSTPAQGSLLTTPAPPLATPRECSPRSLRDWLGLKGERGDKPQGLSDSHDGRARRDWLLRDVETGPRGDGHTSCSPWKGSHWNARLRGKDSRAEDLAENPERTPKPQNKTRTRAREPSGQSKVEAASTIPSLQ